MAMRVNRQSKSLIELIKEHGCKNIIEIGVWKGHTTRNLLRVFDDELDRFWSVDTWNVMGPGHGRMTKMDFNAWSILHARVCLDMYYFKSLRVLRMSSAEAATMFPKGYEFDLVFIDASHYYADVKADIKLWWPRVKKGGLLTGHDYVKPGNRHYGVTEAVNELIGKENITEMYGNVWVHRV